MQAGAGAAPPPRRRFVGLSTRLLVLTVSFVMLSEVLVYVPSIANFRNSWLKDRLATGNVVALSLSGLSEVPRGLQDRLLAATGAMTIAVRGGSMRRLVAMSEMPPEPDRLVDMRSQGPMASIVDAFDTLFAADGRVIRVLGPRSEQGDFIELVMTETPLRQAMLRFSANIMGLSLVISAITAMLVYLSLRGLFLRPLQRLTRAIAAFSENPEDPARIITPSGRADEIGDAERHLAGMQQELAGTLQQKRHLADLGLAVSKINHDLRNILASAQLFTDRLSAIPDKTVQRFAPKLMASLDRAIGYSQAVLNYGKAGEAPPERRLVSVSRLVADVGEVLGLANHASILFEPMLAAELEIDADPDHLFRVLLNLCRNAVQALEADPNPNLVRRVTLEAERHGSVVTIRVADTGPGVPPRARDNLFKAFQGGVRQGGTGLGLAICAELVRAHGGSIELVADGPGAVFEIAIPDRVIELRRIEKRSAGHG